jgi:hypothetical protein
MKPYMLKLWPIATAFIFFSSVSFARRDPWAQHGDAVKSNHDGPPPRTRYNRGEIASGKVYLLIKYKSSVLQRVRNSFSDNERLYRLASSVSSVSKRHKIARVEVDAADKDEVMFELMMENDVEMVEEVSSLQFMILA